MRKTKILVDVFKTSSENIILGLPIIQGKTLSQLIFFMVGTAIKQLEERYGIYNPPIRINKTNSVNIVLTKSDPHYMFVVFPEKLWQKTIRDTHLFCFYFIQRLLDKGQYQIY